MYLFFKHWINTLLIVESSSLRMGFFICLKKRLKIICKYEIFFHIFDEVKTKKYSTL